MSAKFDPYYTWLGISPEEQPPHHYRLLSVRPLEENLDAIENAADRQMKHLRDFQTGKRAEHSQKLLNEIAAARLVLLDPAKKGTYDAELRAKLNATQQAELTKAREELRLAMAKPLPTAAPLDAKPAPAKKAAPQLSTTTAVKPRGLSAALLIAAGVAALVLLAGGIATMMFLAGDQPVATVTPATNDSVPIRPTASPIVPPVISPREGKDEPTVEPPAVVDENVSTETPTHVPPPIDDPIEPIDDDPVEEGAGEEFIAAEDVAPAKLPVPDKAEREAKRRQILQVFAVADARTFEQKGELAAQLIRTAGETADDPAAQFALLNLAREQAAEAGQIKLAFEATDLLADTFEFDGDAVRLASLQQASRATLPPAAKAEIVAAGMDVIDELTAADKFDEADALSDRMLAVARPLRDTELIKSLADQRKAIPELAASHKRAQSALESLKTSPDDAEANLTAGCYLAFVNQDWEAGLAHIAKGSDALLVAAAKAELASPQAPADIEKLADTWWAAGEAQKDATTKNFCRANAGYWYREIVDELSGLSKVRVEKRIEQAGALPRSLKKRELAIVFLDDIAEQDFAVGWGRFSKHGDDVDGLREMRFRDEIPAHSLTMVPKSKGMSHATYKLDGQALKFEAIAGMWKRPKWNTTKSMTPVNFVVVGDGKVLWKSAPIQLLDSGEPCDVDIRGVKTLRLEVHCPGDKHDAWTAWFNPRISRSAPKSGESNPIRSNVDLQRGLVAHWTLDEGKGTIAGDAAGKGTVQGATWIDDGAVGKALSFDGTDDAVLLGNPEALNFEGAISLAAWVRSKRHDTPQGPADVRFFIGHEGGGKEVYLRRSFRGYVCGTGIGQTQHFVASPIPAEDVGAWVHMAATSDGKTWRLYRNGVLLGENEVGIGAVRCDGDWGIGGHASGRHFCGDLDDVRMYRRALSSEEVAALAAKSDESSSEAPSGTPTAPRLEILHATLGENEGQADVTDVIRELVTDESQVVTVSTAGLGLKNPRGKFRKFLTITYKLNGAQHTRKFENGQQINIRKELVAPER